VTLSDLPCPPDCPALARAESWLPCQPSLPERPPWELQRLMLETGRLDLTGVGDCMFPAVKPGDRLIPLAQPVADFQVGQVAVIRRDGNFFGHRVIEVGADERGAYIVTQGDNNGANDGRSYDADVLGVVRAVFRGGRKLAEEELAPRAPGVELWLRQPRQALKDTALAVLRTAQRLPGYRLAAGVVLGGTVKKMALDMRLPLGLGALSALLRKVEEPDLSTFCLKERDDAWLLRATLNNKMHARLKFMRARRTIKDENSQDCTLDGWWLTGLDISLRWARCGLEEWLLRVAAGVLERSGVETLWVREVPELEPFWRRWPVIARAADVPARKVAVKSLME